MSYSSKNRPGWAGLFVLATRVALGLQFLGACGTPQPKAVTTGDGRAALELPNCIEATECFVRADQTCPKGYEVVRWQASRPHVIICE
jgi:hypothetical protein